MFTDDVRSNLAGFHARSANEFARVAERIEVEESELEWEEQKGRGELMRHASASVILSVAGIEASINEVFSSAVDRNYSLFEHVERHRVDAMAEAWSQIDRFSALSKYQIALSLAGRESLDKGSEPYQGTNDLVHLRNALMHFKPEWTSALTEHAKLEKRLRDRFEMSRLAARAPGQMTWLPNHRLGGGCARWAYETAVALDDWFSEVMMIPRRLGR